MIGGALSVIGNAAGGGYATAAGVPYVSPSGVPDFVNVTPNQFTPGFTTNLGQEVATAGSAIANAGEAVVGAVANPIKAVGEWTMIMAFLIAAIVIVPRILPERQ